MKTALNILSIVFFAFGLFVSVRAIKTSYDKKHNKPKFESIEGYNSVSFVANTEPFSLSDTLNQLHLPNQLNEEFFNGQQLYLSTDNYDLTVDFKSGNAIINFFNENTLK